MNPDCEYCGLKDGVNIEHECDVDSVRKMFWKLTDKCREYEAKIEELEKSIHWITSMAAREELLKLEAALKQCGEALEYALFADSPYEERIERLKKGMKTDGPWQSKVEQALSLPLLKELLERWRMKIERLEISGVDEIFQEDFGVERVRDPYMIKLISFANEVGLRGRRIVKIMRIEAVDKTAIYYDFICEDKP